MTRTWSHGAGLAALLAGLAATAAAAPSEVTFTKDVAAILQRSCQNCHRPGQIGPFSMLTYKDARPWAKAIKQQVVQRNMPPWYIDKTVGIQRFENDISLSDREIATISKWVDEGAPEGNPADMPPPRAFDDSDRWHIGKPDIVVHLSQALTVKARQPDEWLDIETQDLGLTEDRYVTAVEIKPLKGARVVHHVTSKIADEDSETGSVTFEDYAVGKYGNTFPDGAGMLLKKGSKIIANVHLHAIGEDTPVDVAFGIRLLPAGAVPKHVLRMALMSTTHDLDIPPNTKDVRSDGYSILTKPAVIVSFQPHMHNRGQAQCLELIEPPVRGGPANRTTRETVSCVDRYKFDWQVVYEYAADSAPVVPAGTVLHQTTWHDNTAGNPANPDSSNWVGWGERTTDEMSLSSLTWYDISDEEYKRIVAQREEKNRQAAAPAIVGGDKH